MRTRPRATPPIAALLAACTASIASAQTTTWTNPNGGLWHDPANWSDGVPTELIGTSLTPMLGNLHLAGQLARSRSVQLASGECVLQLAGASLRIARGLQIGASGQSATMRIAGPGTVQVSEEWGHSIAVGTTQAAVAELTLDAAVVNSDGLAVGGAGVGHITIVNDGVLSVRPYSGGIGIGSGSTVLVAGGGLSGGLTCDGTLRVANGGAYVIPWDHVADVRGTLEVDGATTTIEGRVVRGSGSLELRRTAHAGVDHVSVSSVLLDTGSSLQTRSVDSDSVSLSTEAQLYSYGGPPLEVHCRAMDLAGGSTVEGVYLISTVHLDIRSGSRCQSFFVYSSGTSTVADSTSRLEALAVTGAITVSDGGVLAGDFLGLDFDLGFAHSPRSGVGRTILVATEGRLAFEVCRIFGSHVDIVSGGLAEGRHLDLGGHASDWYYVATNEDVHPYSEIQVRPDGQVRVLTMHVERDVSTGLLRGEGSMTGTISLDGILRPSGFLLDGSITASPTGLVEVSLDAAAPAITATGACNLAPGLMIVTREGPAIAGDSWPIVTASSLSLGDIALPSLPPNLEWDLTQTPTSLSITANTTTARCRPSVDRLSPATIDGYIGDPVLLAAAVSGPVTTMRWHKDGLPLTDGGIYAGTATPTLAIASNAPVNLARYHLIATGPCGKTASLPVDASIRCGGDFNQDFSVDGDDVIDFFGPWDAGEIEADWNHDGAVDGDDVIGFFSKWDAGC